MYGRVYSGKVCGISGNLISVETDISPGLPGICMVGYLASSVKEAGERVKTALKNCGVDIPSRRVTINLYPANIRKEGTNYDLAIAVSIMLSMGALDVNIDPSDTLILGELSLDGRVHPVNGVLPIVHFAAKNGIRRVILPVENMKEASFVSEIQIIGVGSLYDAADAVRYISDVKSIGNRIIELSDGKVSEVEIRKDERSSVIKNDLSDIIGQDYMKRGLIVAVAGMHHLLLSGAAGAGKSMTAKSIPYIMPELSLDEKIEVTKIYSVAGYLRDNDSIIEERPFRSPHSSVTETAFIGGGHYPKPGEVTLANRGVLFLDEFPEFKRSVIEALRQPMEDRCVTVSRQSESITYPANFMLVAARNNCPCGAYPDLTVCHCKPSEIDRYRNKISHPIMDRIDISIEVKPVEKDKLIERKKGITTLEARNIISDAMARQRKRYEGTEYKFNSEVPQNKISEYMGLKTGTENMLISYMKEHNLSVRSYFKIIRLARTVADVNDHDDITEDDIYEAIFYKNNYKEDGCL